MGKTLKIGIAGVNPFDGNRGVAALSYSIVHLLDQISKKDNRSYELFFILNGSVIPKYCTIEVGGKKHSVKILHLVSLFTLKHLIKLFIYFKDFLTYISLDYVMDASYGDSYSDIYGIANFKSHNSIKRFFSFLGKKQLLLPQTVGPFFSADIETIAFRTLNKMQVLLVRDRNSYDYLREHISNAQIAEVLDMAFYLPYEEDYLVKKPGEVHVGLGISKMLWNKGLDKTMSYKDDYADLMRSIISGFLSKENTIIHLIPHVVCENDSKGNDYELCYNLWLEYKSSRIVLSPFFLDPVKAKNYISAMDFFAGSRMHACIAAFSSGVPVYPISYSRKFTGLFNDSLSYEYVGDLTEMRDSEIIDGLMSAFDSRLKIAEIVRNRMSGIVCERKQLMLNYIAHFLNS